MTKNSSLQGGASSKGKCSIIQAPISLSSSRIFASISPELTDQETFEHQTNGRTFALSEMDRMANTAE